MLSIDDTKSGVQLVRSLDKEIQCIANRWQLNFDWAAEDCDCLAGSVKNWAENWILKTWELH